MNVAWLHAQTIKQSIDRDTFRHFYILDSAQLSYLLPKSTIPDTAWLLAHPYTKLGMSDYQSYDTLPAATYLQVQIIDYHVHYTILDKMPFTYVTKTVGDDLLLYLKKQTFKKVTYQGLIDNAIVKYDNIIMNYDSGYGAYIYPKKLSKQKNKSLIVHYNGRDYGWNTNYNPPQRRKTPKYRPEQNKYALHGYIVTDKPMYKPLDTFRAKAYCLDYEGKAINQKMYFEIIDEMDNKVVYSIATKATYKGSFSMAYVLPDTLKTDRNYLIKIAYTKNNSSTGIHQKFTLKDYTLQKSILSATLDKANYQAGDDLKLNVKTTDANGFAINNVRLQYTIYCTGLTALYKDSVLLPTSHFNEWLKVDTVLPYDKVHEFKIDNTLLNYKTATYRCYGTLTTEEFEQSNFDINISYNGIPEQLSFYQKKDSIYVDLKRLGKDSAANFTIKFFDMSNKVVDSFLITTPFKKAIQFHHKYARLFLKDTMKADIALNYNQVQLLQTIGERKARTFTASIKYPEGELVYYKIYKGAKVVKSGSGNTISFNTTDSTLDQYKILISTNTNNSIENNMMAIYFYALNKQIQVKTNLPEQCFPGQNIPLEIEVTDYYGKPLKDIDLTAYAVNGQFGSAISEPYFEIPDSFKTATKSEYLRPTTSHLYAYNFQTQGMHEITKRHIKTFDLYRNEYYQLRYPIKGMQVIKNAKQQPTPELAVFCTMSGQLYLPKYIELNDALLYLTNINNPNQYSYLVNPGKYNLKVRFAQQLIELSNIEITANNKHYVALNFDSIRAKTTKDIKIVADSLPVMTPTIAEANTFKNSLLLLSNINSLGGFIINNNELTQKQSKYNNLSYFAIGSETYNVLLPYNLQQVILKADKDIFQVATGKLINYYDQNKKTFVTKAITDQQNYTFRMSEIAANASIINYQVEVDTLPLIAPKPIPVVAQINKPLPKFYNYRISFYNYDVNRDSTVAIHFLNTGKGKANYAWILNKSNPKTSYYGSIDNYIYANAKPMDSVDIYLFFENNKMATFKNIKIPYQHKLYINPAYCKQDSIKEENLLDGVAFYKELIQLPYTAFVDAPKEENNFKLAPSSIANAAGNAYLSGMLLNEDGGSVQKAMVLIESNGKFVAGATTNAQGSFEILRLKPNIYDIKILHPNYQMRYLYNVKIGGEFGSFLNLILQSREGQIPYMEVINNNFRYLGYTTDSSSMQVEIYDAKKRTAISSAKVLLQYSNKQAITENIIDGQLKLNYEKSTGVVSITVIADGYNATSLAQLNLPYTMRQELTFFLNKKNGKNDEYSLTMPEFYKEDAIDYRKSEISAYDDQEKTLDVPILNAPAPTSSAYYSMSNESTKDVLAASTISGAATYYSIDGVRDIEIAQIAVAGVKKKAVAKPSANEDEEENDVAEPDNEKMEESKKQDQKYLFNEIINSNLANQYRNYFTDVAYWFPHLKTDINGKAFTSITMPHNITLWKTFTVGMGEQFKYGKQSSSLKAYKPIQTIAYTPTFLRKGDSIWVKSKFTNLLSDTKNVQLFYEVDRANRVTKDIVLKNTYSDSMLLTPMQHDSIEWIAGLKFQDKYTDAEQIKIPVLDNGLTQYKQQSLLMDSDSTYTLSFDAGTKSRITFNNTLYERILEYTKDLENYEYGCVEQTASKIKALVYQQQIMTLLNKPFTKTKTVNKLIRVLEDMQNKNGSFGWWRKDGSDTRMTVYAYDALTIAEKYGYRTIGAMNAETYLQKLITKNKSDNELISKEDYLYAIYTLANHKKITLQEKMLADIDVTTLNTTNKIYFYKLQTMLGKKVELYEIYNLCLAMENQNNNPSYGNFFYDPQYTTFNSYLLFKNTYLEKEFNTAFRNKILNGSLERNLNTFSKASLIELLLQEASTSQSTSPAATLTINGSKKIVQYPYTMDNTNSRMLINHKGGPVFVHASETYNVQNPKRVDTTFMINTSFIQNNKSATSLQLGEKIDLKIDIDAFASKEYVMVTIPLPAGVIVADKKQLALGFTEYRKDKIIIYASRLSQGLSSFSIPIQAVYSGQFMMPPAQVKMMYYEFVNGNNQEQKISISK